jgi:hypothetical protein
MIEGLALAAFSLIRDFSSEPLAKAINTYVMQDEARHVAFGRLALRDYYPQLTEKERAEREEFVAEASLLMYGRFMAQEVWTHLGFDFDEIMDYVANSDMMLQFRKMLFSRIVPIVKDIGLLGPRTRKVFQDLGVMEFESLNPDELSAADEQIAEEMEGRKAEIEATIRAGAAAE